MIKNKWRNLFLFFAYIIVFAFVQTAICGPKGPKEGAGKQDILGTISE